MQKAVKILEKNAEWIALGLGGLFVLLIVWKYVLTPPTITVGGKVAHASDVDQVVADAAAALKRDMDRTDYPAMPKIEFAERFVSSMKPTMRPTLAVAPFNSPPAAQALDVPENLVAGGPTVAKLPGPLVPSEVTSSTGRSQVLNQVGAPGMGVAPIVTPVFNARPIPASRLRPGARPTNVRPTGERPIAPPPPPPVAGDNGAAQPVNPDAIDKVWVTIFAKIHPDDLTKMFDEIGLPGFARNTVFLEVQLERQEIGPDGKLVGKPVIVHPLPLNAPPADVKTPADLVNWASQPENQVRILQPSFYQILQGDLWLTPEQIAAGAANAAQQNNVGQQWMPNGVFDPQAAYTYMKSLPTPKEQNDFRNSLPADQRRQLYQTEQEEKAKEAQQNHPVVRPTGEYNGRPGGRPGRGGGDVTDPSIFREMLADARDFPPVNRRPSMRPTSERPGMVVPQPGVPAVPGQVDANGEMQIWAHDDSVESGKTYIYRIRVIYKNPLWGTSNLAKDPNLAKQLGIPDMNDKEQGWSAWSKPVKIPQMLNIYLVSGNGGKARFKVLKWQNAKANIKEFTVEPGDTVGGMDKASGVDYSTGWTLVDVRQIGRDDARATLVNSSDQIATHTFRADQTAADQIKTSTPPAGTVGYLGR